jgi:membrane protease YdiL (CAAX protease family)
MEHRKKPLLGNLNLFSQAIVLLGIVLVSMGLFSIAGIFLAKAFFGVDFLGHVDLMSQLNKPSVLNSLKLLQIFNAVGGFILPPLTFAFLIAWNAGKYLRLNRLPALNSLFAVLLIMFAAIPLINWLGEVNAMMKLPDALSGLEKWMKEAEENAAKFTKAFLRMNNITDFIVDLFIIAIIPAIGEELLFRGALLRILKNSTKNKHLAIWITAIVFSAIHMQFYGFIPRMLMGAYLGYLVTWSGSLWLAVFAHFINNGAVVIAAYFFKNDLLGIDPDKIGTGNNSSLLVCASIVVVFFLTFQVRRFERTRSRLEDREDLVSV